MINLPEIVKTNIYKKLGIEEKTMKAPTEKTKVIKAQRITTKSHRLLRTKARKEDRTFASAVREVLKEWANQQ